jgi:uncharacterized protein
MAAKSNHHADRFHVVAIGIGPVGKTSLINALLGRSAGETGATIGTTAHGLTHTYSVDGVEGTLLLTDTPSLGDPGPEGKAREAEAFELASHADLVLFLVDHDLTRLERDTLSSLSRLGKRLITVLNKKDRFTEEDRVAILEKLRERLEGVVPPQDILAVAADPAPVAVHVRNLDGTGATELEVVPPELEALEARVAEIIATEGDLVRAGNLLLGARLREQHERARLARDRRDRAVVIIERHQWLAAATSFANPVAALAPLAAGAVQVKMLGEMAAAYDVALSPESIELVGRQMASALFKLGIAEMAASVLAGTLKLNPLGFAAGGFVQAVTMGYLTRVAGTTFLEYLEHDETWGEGGMQATLARHLESSRSAGWLMQLSKEALARLLKR